MQSLIPIYKMKDDSLQDNTIRDTVGVNIKFMYRNRSTIIVLYVMHSVLSNRNVVLGYHVVAILRMVT